MKFRDDVSNLTGGSKNFLKLKDKESVSGIFKGDLHEYFIVWENGKSREVPEGTPKAGFRFRVNFVMKEGSTYSPKIFENGPGVYAQLKELHDEYGLDSIVVKITRNGTGLDTTYSILPLLKQTLSKEAVEFISTLTLHPLENKDNAPSARNVNGDDIPF